MSMAKVEKWKFLGEAAFAPDYRLDTEIRVTYADGREEEVDYSPLFGMVDSVKRAVGYVSAKTQPLMEGASLLDGGMAEAKAVLDLVDAEMNLQRFMQRSGIDCVRVFDGTVSTGLKQTWVRYLETDEARKRRTA